MGIEINMRELSLYNFGKEKLAPVLYAYIYWVLKEAKKRDIHTLYFLARDGYIMNKIARVICENEELDICCRYLYCSRMSLRMPTYHLIDDEAYDLIFAQGYHVTVKTFFERVGLPSTKWNDIIKKTKISHIDISKELSINEIKNVREKLCKNTEFVKFVNEESINAFDIGVKYLQQESVLSQSRVAIVDSGWTGSMQRSLRQILEYAGWKGNILGFYFGLYKIPKKEDGEYFSFYFNGKGDIQNKALFCNNLFEIFTSAPHGMTIGYQKNKEKITPIFAEPVQKVQLEKIKNQIEGVMDGVNKIVREKNKYDKKYCQKVLRKIMGFPTKEISIMYGEFTFCDDITEKYQMKINGVEQKRVLKDQLILNKLIRKIRGQKQNPIFWEFGLVSLIKNPIKRRWYWINIYIWKVIMYMVR
ncbi:hypothetical protein [Roseburia faecis]|uniref:hypothetical protein n=1 Tax=Roseburia faecis TaxID=301302 RepID=UPI00189CEFDA|nr:hypothetical protein [Roseburia faecis]